MCRAARTRNWNWKLLLFCSMGLSAICFGIAGSARGEESAEPSPPATTTPKRTITPRLRLNISTAAPRATRPAPPSTDDSKLESAVRVATHHQASTLQVNTTGQKPIKLSCFCLTPDDHILAGGTGQPGELRVLDAEGKYVNTWEIPVSPEAIYARNDGTIFVAGEGQVVKLSPKGAIELKKEAPHFAALNAHPEKLREEVIAQAKKRAEQLGRQSQVYDQMIERADKEIAAIQEQIAALETPQDKAPLEQRLAVYNKQKEAYSNAKERWADMMKSGPNGALTDEQIDAQVKASMVSKQKASSISATGDDVFLATRAATGYGFDIWRMDNEFDNATLIVKDLSGCCGQMDVKANKDGVFVAENSRHRVRRFDRDGKELGAWGVTARTGLEGFGSCCNPMNVAFGPGSDVYTAEDDTGRIKRYSPEGKLLGLVGAVELKPGCKNVSISVSSDGSRVYMLDITRNYLVQLDARAADEIAAEIKALKDAPPAAQPQAEAGADAAAPKATTVSRIKLRDIRARVAPVAPQKDQ
jgi:hypothetical protein